ncbi:hypothetical protein Taro_019945, partial [Colocasia esculenta]|nr:hypothetical protein [Colocasia esculenta]
ALLPCTAPGSRQVPRHYYPPPVSVRSAAACLFSTAFHLFLLWTVLPTPPAGSPKSWLLSPPVRVPPLAGCWPCGKRELPWKTCAACWVPGSCGLYCRILRGRRMGTKVHCKSYLPGYYSMRNINENPNSSWPRYYEDRTLNGQFCNGFSPRPLNEYLDYDKEALKQTMLRHEEIFRKQVLELHRLYRKQRDLMEELRRNEEKSFSILVKSSQTSPISNQMLPKDMEKLWQVDGYPSTGATCSRAPISGADYPNNHLNPLNGGSLLRKNGTSLDNQLPDSRFMKHPRKMLDLELPAEAYIDNEDANNPEENHVIKPLFASPDPGKRGYALQTENDMKLTLSSAQNPCSRDETRKSSSDLQNRLHTRTLADLNEPLNDESCEEMATSSGKFPAQMTFFQGHRGHQKSVESVACFRGLQEDLSQDRYHGRDGSVSMHMEREEEGEKLPFFNNEFGQSSSHVNSFTSSLGNKNGRSLPEPVPVSPIQAQDFSPIFPPRQHQNESWFREKQYQGSEPSDRRYHAANKVLSGLTVPAMPGSLSAPVIDYSRTGSRVVSPWKEPSNNISHLSRAAQGFPCFGVSTTTNIQSTSLHHIESGRERWQRDRDFSSMQKLGSEAHFYSNGFSPGLQYKSAAASVYMSSVGSSKPNLNNAAHTSYGEPRGHGYQMPLNGFHYMDAKTVKGMNLNLEPPNGFQNGFTPKAKTLSDMEGKKEDPSGGIPWLRTKSPGSKPCRTTDKGELQVSTSVDGHSQPMPSYCLSAREVEQKTETVVGSSLEVMQDLSSALKPIGTTIEQNETVFSSSNSKILGFTLSQRTRERNSSFTTILHKKISPGHDEAKNRAKEGFSPADSSCQSKPLDLEKHIHTEVIPEKGTAESVHCFRPDINLNSSATSMDQLKSSESSSEDEIKLPPPPSARGSATRFALEIDLEAPPTSVEEEQAPLLESAPQIDQLVQPVEPECREEDLQTTGSLDEVVARIAAEAIQMISLDRAIHLEDAACRPLPTASADTLHWFADMVTSNGDTPENNEALKCRRNIDQESSDIDGMDYFEYMTLNLAETIVEEYCFRPMEEEQSEEEAGVAHLLLTRPRRGQARWRRQRRDFQRDILPGLASLSRQEVTEDMQIIASLMKALGQPWKAGGARRNAARSRPRRQARGGRRPRTATTSAVAEAPVVPPPKQSNKKEATNNGRSILGWGRTTKRCRSQRSLPGNPPPS